MVICDKANSKKCPLPSCPHREPHVQNGCTKWGECYLESGNFIKVRCIDITSKEGKKQFPKKEDTSAEWYEEIKDFCEIIDPDGWDRKNFNFSWHESITKDEFLNRLYASTVKCHFGKLIEWGRE